MFTFPRFARLEASRSLRAVVFALSACVFAFALHLSWLAFTAPLEIEIREGSVWIQVLAKRAGIDIYDTTQVAFVNMNHGPLDPILKAWISRCAPMLPGHMVTRIFVLLTPVFLLASAYVITGGQLAVSMLAAGSLFLVLAQMSVMVFVGRADATAVCLVAVCGALAHRLLVTRHRNWSNRRYIATQVGLGAASAAVFLTSWRFAPVIAALQVAVLSTQLAGSNLDPRPTSAAPEALAAPGARGDRAEALRDLVGALRRRVCSHLAAGVLDRVAWRRSILLPAFLRLLPGCERLGNIPGAVFRIVPSELLDRRLASILLFAALILWGLYRLRKAPGALIAWLVMLTANWFAVAYGYFKNQSGGGLHYFFEFFALAWIFILHAFFRRLRWGALAQLVLGCVVVLTLPRRDLLAQREFLAEARKQGRVFRQRVADITQGQPVFSEETHLFKAQYQDELVDTGDTDAAVAGTEYFGGAFTRTFERHTRRLTSNPPKFVIGGLLEAEADSTRIMTAELRQLLKTRYQLRVVARRTAFATTAGSQALFERVD